MIVAWTVAARSLSKLQVPWLLTPLTLGWGELGEDRRRLSSL